MRPVLPARDVAAERLELLDWKRRIFDLYRGVRADDDPARAWRTWRAVRDDLIANHPQSPVDEPRRGHVSPSYFEYDPAARVRAEVVPLKLEQQRHAARGILIVVDDQDPQTTSLLH